MLKGFPSVVARPFGRAGLLIAALWSCSADAGTSSVDDAHPDIVTTSLRSGTVGVAYSETLAAIGGTGSYRWAIAAGSPPSGLALGVTNGALTGRPATAATYTFVVRAISGGLSDVQPYTITIAPAGQATGEPAFNPATQTLVYRDNMDQYTTATAMGDVNGRTDPRIAPYGSPVVDSRPVDTDRNQVITPGRGDTGKALRMLYTGAVQDGADYDVLDAPRTDNNDTHYFQYWARITYPGAPTSLGNQTIAIKWFMAWHRIQDNARVQWNTHGGWPCPIGPNGSNPLGRTRTYWQVYDGSTETTCQAMQPTGPYFDGLADGEWHRYTYAYRSHTAEGARDGFAQMWIDGTKVVDISRESCGTTPPLGEKVWCTNGDLDMLFVDDGIRMVRWGGVHTDNPAQSWTYDIDDFSWWITP